MATSSQRSPNVLSVGDTVWCSLYGWNNSPVYPLLVRVMGFTKLGVAIEAVDRSDDIQVDNDWEVAFSNLRREYAAQPSLPAA